MLHTLTGPVVHGQGKGAAAGFPTANLRLLENAVLPPKGVYWTRVSLDGRSHLGVTNVGLRPTADDRDEITVETFLPDDHGNLYGKTIELTFLRYLRKTAFFPSMAALKEQIDRDAEAARAWAARCPEADGFLTFSAEETRALSAQMAQGLTAGSVLVLRGDMGAGKSEFSRGVARGLGVTGPVPSPSFTILNVYDEGRLPLYHFDWYRVEDPEELYEIGAQEYLPGSGVTLVEWAERAEDLLPEKRTEVFIQPIAESVRLILVSPCRLSAANLLLGDIKNPD